ncbi:hypothetical protein CEXT_655791 [Caerostris extrusa]|uniref:Uncharacterized protein n=1 Tax=Caerostris extrusa TaxID=172846 RepID=A0AAV4WEM6_CAEEX|nr:hypothetical protein CEXT_655791 [Caerostris extrusa]
MVKNHLLCWLDPLFEEASDGDNEPDPIAGFAKKRRPLSREVMQPIGKQPRLRCTPNQQVIKGLAGFSFCCDGGDKTLSPENWRSPLR